MAKFLSNSSRFPVGWRIFLRFLACAVVARVGSVGWVFIAPRFALAITNHHCNPRMSTPRNIVVSIARHTSLAIWHRGGSHRKPDRNESPSRKHFALLDIKSLCTLTFRIAGQVFPNQFKKAQFCTCNWYSTEIKNCNCNGCNDLSSVRNSTWCCDCKTLGTAKTATAIHS